MSPRFPLVFSVAKGTLSSIGEIPPLVILLGYLPVFRNASLLSCQLILDGGCVEKEI